MTNQDFQNVVVRKPWGAERLLRGNNLIGLWHLHLEPGKCTSLHCHPFKKTGLVVLSGMARVDFMNGSMEIGPLGKVMIRHGLFHRTTAISGDLELLEIETPPDKFDLVRLEDNYGRSGQPYESGESYSKVFDDIRLDDVHKRYDLAGCALTVIRDLGVLPNLDGNDLIMVLYGGLVANVTYEDSRVVEKYVISAGDVVNVDTFRRLMAKFRPSCLEMLVISGGNVENVG